MPRFFARPEDISLNEIKIYGEEYKHIKNVLRLKRGDNITVSDGMGIDYAVTVESFEINCVVTRIVRSQNNFTEPPIDITLFQGIPKSDKMDLIIQKSIELGVKRIFPVLMERTVVRFGSDKDIDNKASRWQRIAFEAAKQCSRGIIPKIERPVTYDYALELSKESQLSIVPYEKEKSSTLKQLLRRSPAKSVAVFIGPEGGFSEDEVKKAELSEAVPVTLGPRILRTETAGIAVLSILMYELGDVSK